MASIQRAHVEQLLQLNRAHLRELETQQAKLGVLAPSGIAVQLAEYQRAIVDLPHPKFLQKSECKGLTRPPAS